MNNQEAIEVMFNEWKCIDRNDGIHCDRKCETCDLVMDVGIIREAFNMAISALEKMSQLPQKHGRLIDADAFKTDYRMSDDCDSCDTNWKSCQYDTVYAKMDFCGWLDDAPTVIEAEGE